MDLAERYLSAVQRLSSEAGFDGQLTPTVLTRACVEALPVTGAGITMHDTLLRLPLGSSDASSAWVEQLQATLGDGPCVDAMAANTPLVAGPDTMMLSWPIYTPQVFAHTVFRSVAAIPLCVPDGPVFGALTLFAVGTDLASLLDLDEVRREVGDLIAGILSGQLAGGPFDGLAELDWWHTEGLAHRRQVWMAVAIISGAAHLTETGALDTLRAHALRHRLSLDKMAERLITEHSAAG